MVLWGFRHSLPMAAAILLVAAGGQSIAADNGMVIDPAVNLAALSAQRDKTASAASRQLGLVQGRLDGTRGLRVEGRNIHSSSLAIRFTGRSKEKSAAFETRHLLAPEKERRTRRGGVWFAGDVTLDSARAEDPRRSGVYSNGVAFGGDLRLNPRLLIGNATGAAFGRTGFGAEGTLTAQSLSNTLYGSLTTSRDTYLDLAIGASHGSFLDGQSGAASPFSGNGSANQFFGQARYSRKLERGRFRFRSYGQADFQKMKLDTSRRAGTGEPTSGSASSEQLNFALGIRGETSARMRKGTMTPHVTVEVSRTTQRTSAVAEGSAERAMTFSRSRSGKVSARTGLDWAISDRANMRAEYSLSSVMADFHPQQKVSARFKLSF